MPPFLKVLPGLDRPVDAGGRRRPADPLALAAVLPHAQALLLLQVLRPGRRGRVQARHLGLLHRGEDYSKGEP